jgi:uncharacterized protein involved in type VI secretion and phage assembly
MAQQSAQHVAGIDILVDGAPLDQEYKDHLSRAEVHSEIGASDSALLRITDPGATQVDSNPLELDKTVEIKLGALGDATTTSVFKGAITSVAPEFHDGGCTITIRAHDGTPKLTANVHHRVFDNQSYDEVVSRVASDAGLRRGRVDRVAAKQKRIIQAGLSDYAFCKALADEIGWDFTVRGDVFDFTKRAPGSDNVSVAFGDELLSFSPRVSTMQQVSEVQVTGWDPQTKQKISASARSASLASSIGLSRDKVANGSSGVLRIADHPVTSRDEAMAIAQGSLDAIAQGYLVADGLALGNPKMRAGVTLTVSKVGRQFSGGYLLSSVTHVFRGGKGYETRFTSRGRAAQKLVEVVDTQKPDRSWARGLVIGIVSNNNDPDQLGRVKVKYPSLDDMESEWAPVVTLGAGKDRGVMMVPQPNEAVLVGFLHGDPDAPHVVGSLHNGKDVPGTDLVQSKDGSFAVRSDKKLLLKSKEPMTLHTDKDLVIEVTGSENAKVDKDVTQKIGGKLTAEATGAVSQKSSQSYAIEAGSSLTIKANASITIEAQGSLSLKGTTVDITGNAAVNIKASLINLG